MTKCQTKIELNLSPLLQDEAVFPRPDNDGVPNELPAGNFAARWRCQDISLDERSKKQHQLHPVLRLYEQEKIFSRWLVDHIVGWSIISDLCHLASGCPTHIRLPVPKVGAADTRSPEKIEF